MSLSCMADIFRHQGVVAADFLAALNDQQVLVVEGLGGGWDARSLTPRCSATRTRYIRAMWHGQTRHLSNTSAPPPPPPPVFPFV